MAKIFVRHRRHVSKGDRRPRFAIVAVEGADLNVYREHVRRVELETIAQEISAEIVYLPRGEHADEPETGAGKAAHKGSRRRRRPREEA